MLELTRSKAGLLLELAVRRRQHILAWLDQALGQRQLVFVGTTAILLHQHRVLGIEHRHDHHRAITVAAPDQAFVGALGAVGKAQLHGFDTEQAAAGDDLAREDGGFLAHGAAPWRERVTIPWLAD
ncbi:hypothetical protein D3C75_953590 [compost metagenome]